MRRASASDSLLTEAQRLAASEGAKGMMPFGRPFLDYVMSALADAGMRDVTLVIGPEHETIRTYYTQTSPPRRLAVHFAEQVDPKGTADAVLAAEGSVGGGPFLVLNSDNYYPVAAFRALASLGTSGLVGFDAATLVREGGIEEDRVLRYALLVADATGRLMQIREKPRSDDPLVQRPDRMVSLNVWSFTESIFEACRRVTVSERGELELIDAVTIAKDQLGERFQVVPMAAAVYDLSSRADIEFVAAKLARFTPDP
jgi:glucose-1-phosphate thymidylyltransferase